MAIATRWQDVKCHKCGQLLTNSMNAVVELDHVTGGLKGFHQACPIPEPYTASPADVLALTLTVARILRARLAELSPTFFNEDHAALTEALAPFDPLSSVAESGVAEKSKPGVPPLTLVKKD